MSFSRRAAIHELTLRGGALLAGSSLLGCASAPAQSAASAPAQSTITPTPPRTTPVLPPPLPADLVKAFVGAAHSDLAKVTSMLDSEPHLINATWDWKAGDFETALGGASHMGRPDIAAYLLSKGARMDLFCAAMMGKLDVVRACVTDDPSIVTVKGPHGITLLRHAQAGKQEAVIAYLTSAGA